MMPRTFCLAIISLLYHHLLGGAVVIAEYIDAALELVEFATVEVEEAIFISQSHQLILNLLNTKLLFRDGYDLAETIPGSCIPIVL